MTTLGVPAWAQYDNGSLVGTVKDASGASVAGANVTATNTATGITAHTVTNSSGDYEFPDLKAGSYSVTAETSGFSPAEARNINVSVASRVRIDLTLKVGAEETTVEVVGLEVAPETETSERGQTISNYQTASLPLVSRNYSDLLALVPGSRQAPTAATTTSVTSLVRAGAYNVNGQRSMFNNYLLDGLDNNAYGESNQGFDNQIIQPPPDSVAQFQVVTNNESAEYGRSSGATINVASKSGTNQFHATLYEFLRNTDLNAFGFIKPVSGTFHAPKPGFNRNQFGANFSGPALKNKFFWFLDYEGFRQTLTPAVVLTVPTQDEINGILKVDVTDPFSGTLYPKGTSILTSPDASPIAKQILAYYGQLPSQCITAPGSPSINQSTGLASNNCATNAPFTDNADKGDLRLDYQQNERNSWFLRISDRKETGINYRTLPGPLDGQTNGRIRILDQQIVLGYTGLFGNNKVVDARLGLSGTKAGKYTLSIGENDITFPGLPTDPTVAGGLPSIGVSGGFSGFGRQSTNPQWQNPSLLNPKVNFSWVKSKHSFKFGYEYGHIWMEVQDSNPLFGSFTFGKGYSVCPATDETCPTNPLVADTYWADFLFGASSNYALATYFKAHLLDTMHNAYAQDDWKVNSKLTLNLGVRWEYSAPYSEKYNNLSNWVPETVSMLTLTKGYAGSQFIQPYKGGGVYGKTLVNPDFTDFAPRIGFAWQFVPETVLRGGFGTSYAHYTRAGSGDILAINAPNALFVSVGQPSKVTLPGYRTMDQGYPPGQATNFSPGTDNITYVPKNTRDSYVENWYLSVQRQLWKNTLVDLAYVGNHGLKLQGFYNANQGNPALGLASANPGAAPAGAGFARPYPTWGGDVGTTWTYGDITTAGNVFWSHFNALQAKYEQRFVQGLTLLNSFTWERAADNASASLEGNTPSPQDANNLKADYSQSDYNLPVANITSLVYEIPVGHGRKYLGSANSLVDAVLGGWQVSAVNTMQGGTPFNIGYTPNSTQAVSPQISATYRGANEYRPNKAPGVSILNCNGGHSCVKNVGASGTVQYVNPAAFTLPAIKSAGGTLLSPFGDASRNPGRTPKFYESDLDFNKKFHAGERFGVEFRAELYNVFNHTNLYLPSSGLSGTQSSTGALNPATGGGTISGTFEPRIVQFGLKVTY